MNIEDFKRGGIIIKKDDVLPGFIVNRKTEYWDYCVAGQDLYFNSVEGVFVLVPVDFSDDNPFIYVKPPKGKESNQVCDEVFKLGYGSEYSILLWTTPDMSGLEARIASIKDPSAGVIVTYVDEQGNRLTQREFNN